MSITDDVRRSLLLLTALVCVQAPMGLSGCSAGESHPTSAARAAAPVLQFGVVADPGEKQGTTEYKRKDGTIRLREVRTFEIQEASPTKDALGYPAIHFEIADAQKEEFRSWTASIIDHQLAILIDGVVVTAPKVRSALPGSGIVQAGPGEWSEQDVKSLVARIRGGGQPPTK